MWVAASKQRDTLEVGIDVQDTRQRERGCCAYDGLVRMLARVCVSCPCLWKLVLSVMCLVQMIGLEKAVASTTLDSVNDRHMPAALPHVFALTSTLLTLDCAWPPRQRTLHLPVHVWPMPERVICLTLGPHSQLR